MTASDMTVYIRAHVSAYCALSGETRKQLAEKMGMPYSTFITKLNGPSEFSYKEGIRLSKLIGVSPDDMTTPIN